MLLSRTTGMILIMALLLPLAGIAQIKVTRMEPAFRPEKGGMVYALPRTLIKIDVSVEKKDLIAGPFHNFAEEYLGVNDYINSNASEYTITHVDISSLAEPDPDQYFYVSLEPKTSKEQWQSILTINGIGLITSMSALNDVQDAEASAGEMSAPDDFSKMFPKYAGFNIYRKVDTIVRTVNIDTMTIKDFSFQTTIAGKSLKMRAEEAATMISKIRESRYNLLTGYQEINYSEGAIKYMDTQLLALEEEYMRLFTGATRTSVIKYTFIFLPQESAIGENTALFKLSRSSGIQEGGSGETVSIRIGLAGNTARVAPVPQGGGFHYRLPEMADIRIYRSGVLLSQTRLPISQFGKIASLPVNASDVSFDENTGGLRSVKLVSE